VLSTPEGFRQMTEIIASGFQGVVVVSAFSTTTRKLEFIGKLAQKGLLQEALEAIKQLLDDHANLVKILIPKTTNRDSLLLTFNTVSEELYSVVEAVSVTRQLTARTLDKILSMGELLALHIATAVLSAAGIQVQAVDATSLIITNETHGSAEPLLEKSRYSINRHLIPALELTKVVVVQGFVGSTEQGAVTTMGKESSNLTASILGALLTAEEIVIYTDVEGIRSADPHVCENTRIRAHLSYRQASIAAHNGLKLLYPTMIAPAQSMNIPIRISSASLPNGECTMIDGMESDVFPIIIEQTVESGGSTVTTVFCDTAEWMNAAKTIITSLPRQGSPNYIVNVDSKQCVAKIQFESSLTLPISELFHQQLCKQ